MINSMNHYQNTKYKQYAITPAKQYTTAAAITSEDTANIASTGTIANHSRIKSIVAG